MLVKELDKVALSKGAWTTILFRYQQWRPETSDYGPDKYVIQRYKKSGGEYRRQSKFNIFQPGTGAQAGGRPERVAGVNIQGFFNENR